MKKKHLLITVALLIGLSIYSCKNSLNPPLDSVTQSQAAGSNAYLNSIVLGTYTKLQSITGNDKLLLNADETTDAIIVPGRVGGDWADGGQWQQMYLHTYPASHPNINNAWNDAFDAIGTINITIGLLQGLPSNTSTTYSINEMRALRAYYYFLLVNNYGNVPLITSSSVDATTVKTTAAKDVFTYLISELKDVGPKLSAKTPAQDASQYGRLNKWGAYFLLAKLYLNQNVITGSTDNSGYTAANSYCDSLMTAGYSLNSDYLSNFSSNNTGSPENIFVIPYDHINATGLQFQMMTFHYNQAGKYNFGPTGGPWNGFTTTADYYGRYNNADKRKAGWQAGQQFDADGVTPLTTRGSDSSLALNFRPLISSLYAASERDGVRNAKWSIVPGFQSQDADYALMRYADVLLMKAELQFRLGNQAAALTYTAPVRSRAGMANFTSAAFAIDSIYYERGREFAYEGWRRQDAIRFGHFGDARVFKPTDADKHSQLFPIPTSALQKNPNLTQNPGY